MRIKYPEAWSQSDCDALDEMFRNATASGLWFYHGGMSGPLWFAPHELQAEQEKGQFVWGTVNWRLRDPQEAVVAINKAISNLIDERNRLLDRIESWRARTR